jgi:hypothetical protein
LANNQFITPNTGYYSITFRIANSLFPNTNPANPIRIGIYGVRNPNNIAANNPVNTHVPANTNLWNNPSVQVVLLGTVTPPNNFNNTWWTPPAIVFNSNMLPPGGINYIMVTADDQFRPNNPGKLYVNFDEFCIRRADPPKFCCKGINGGNMVVNGNFEGGNTGFTSNYNFDPTLNGSLFTPGKYNIVNGSGAASLNAAWTAQDPSTCQNNNGMFLMVNGSSGATPPQKLIWKSTNLPVKIWSQYTFCFKAKSFKVPPSAANPVTIEIKFNGFANTPITFTETIPIINSACQWQSIMKVVGIWTPPINPNIEIWLNENVNGANDLAIDDIALIEVPPCPPASTQFNITTQTISATDYNINAVRTQGNASPCSATWWEVCEYSQQSSDCSGNKITNPTTWWSPNVWFDGYNNGSPKGVFKHGKIYRISFGTWDDCYGWAARNLIVGYSKAAKAVKFYPEEDVKKNKKLLDEILK